MTIKYFFIIIFLLFLENAYAYPTYVRLNYTSCLACHQSIEGGGPLTSYGKGIAFAESFKKGEYKALSPKMMEHSVEGRMMALKRMYEYSGSKTRIFPMQLDYSNIVHWRKDIRQEVTAAVAPSTSKKSPWTDRVYLRTFKLDYTLDKNNHVVVGGANLPMGVRLIDHTAYVRERNRLGVTDVPLQIQYLNLSKTLQQSFITFFPNPNDNIKNREYGIAIKEEYFYSNNFAIGGQGLGAKGKSIDREMIGTFMRTGIGAWALMAEIDFTRRHIVNSDIGFSQWTSLIEGSYFPKEFLRSSLGFQVLRVNKPFLEKEELYTFNNEFKYSANTSFILEYRQKSTAITTEKTILSQAFLNWW